MPESRRIAVVGAGIAGLSAAYQLKKAGFEVIVFEKNQYVGGRMATKEVDGFVTDIGADFLVNGWYSLLQSYAHELGVHWRLSEEGSRHRIVRGGVPRSVDIVGPREVLNFEVLSFRARVAFLLFLAKIKFFSGKLDFFDLSSNPEDLDQYSADEYIRTHIHAEVSDYVADPFTSIMQFHRADEISASAFFSLVQAMMDASRGFRVAYTPGGMGSIPEALAEKVGVRYGADVVSVSSVGGKVEVVHGQGTELFDAVILATTGDSIQKMLKRIPESLSLLLGSLRYAETCTLAFTVPTDLFRDSTHLTYVPFVENQIISGYDNTIRKDPQAHRDGRSVLNVYLHEEASKKYRGLKDDALLSLVKENLLLVAPEIAARASEVKPLAVARMPYAMPKFTGEYSKSVRDFFKNGQGDRNIFLAGDYLNSPWTEGAARSGKRAAESVIQLFAPETTL